MKHKFLIGFLFLSILAFSQAKKVDSLMNIPAIVGSFAYDIPGGDMADRWGNNSEIGAGFYYKTKKNWIFAIEAMFIFAEGTKEDSVINLLLTSQGTVTGVADGFPADVRVFERGYKMPMVKVGKVLPLRIGRKAGVNSGFYVMGGVGLMQHKIKFEVVTNDVPMLEGEYIKGFDRLTNGLALTQNLGYMYFSKNNLVNFFITAEITEGFTKSRRSYDFASKSVDTKQRLDLLYGLKIGWMFTIRKKLATGYYYY